MEEKFIDIQGYEGLYKISNSGIVISCERKTSCIRRGSPVVFTTPKKILKYDINRYGYYTVKLCKDDKPKHFSIHRLVAIHFVENPLNLPAVNHKNGNKLINWDWNLEWCTNDENITHAFENGLMKSSRSKYTYERTDHSMRENIKKLFSEGVTKDELAKMYSKNKKTIYNVVHDVHYSS